MSRQEIVLRRVGSAADDFASIRYLIDAVDAGTATKDDADDAEAGLISLENNGVPVRDLPAKAFSWQNISLGFVAGIATASIAYLAMNPKPTRRSYRRLARAR